MNELQWVQGLEWPNVRFKDFYSLKDPKVCEQLKLTATVASTAESALASIREALSEWQVKAWRAQKRAVLVVIQGTDAAGKDSAIRHVFSGLNPAGLSVRSFKQPTQEESSGYYLTRYMAHLPLKGCISVFNRSYYEDVLVPVIHPEQLSLTHEQAHALVNRRLDELIAWERSLFHEHILVLKFYLNVSKSEQGRRLWERLEDPKKHYKFAVADVRDRRQFEAMQAQYAKVFKHTHQAHAPWYIIPADHKPSARWLIASVLRARIAEWFSKDATHTVPLPDGWQAAKTELEQSLSAAPTQTD